MTENQLSVIGGESLPITYNDIPQGIIPLDMSGQIAALPSRISWDKKAGLWVSDLIEETSLEGRLLAATFLYALWGDNVGQPLEFYVGLPPEGVDLTGFETGIRIFFEHPVLGYFYSDFFGISFRSAQSVVKWCMANGANFRFKGRTEVNTKFGRLYLPQLVKEA